MTRLLEQAIEVVGRQPETSQNDFARAILHLAGSELEAEPVEPAHFGGSAGGLAQAKRREFATDNDVGAALVGEAAIYAARDARPCCYCGLSAYP